MLPATAGVVTATPSGFEVYSGDDSMTLPLLSVGAVGAIGVATHWCAPDHVEMFDAWQGHDIDAARNANARQLESFAFETGDAAPNPVPSKAMLRTLGHAVGEQTRMRARGEAVGVPLTAAQAVRRVKAVLKYHVVVEPAGSYAARVQGMVAFLRAQRDIEVFSVRNYWGNAGDRSGGVTVFFKRDAPGGGGGGGGAPALAKVCVLTRELSELTTMRSHGTASCTASASAKPPE